MTTTDFLSHFWEAPPRILEKNPGEVDEPYRKLLWHRRHMTAELEGFHGPNLKLKILQENREPGQYSREVLLYLGEGSEVPVEIGMIHCRLDKLPAPLAQEVREGNIPFGRILSNHHLQTEVDCFSLFELELTPELAHRWQLNGQGSGKLYGRRAGIFYQGEKIVDTLEILPPLRPKS